MKRAVLWLAVAAGAAALTVAAFLMLNISDMGRFEALINSLGSVSNAGMLIHPGGLEYYNSYYIEDGSFARLDNMTLSYSLLPKNMLGVSRIRFYGTVHNLMTITKYKGVDPEVPMSGLDPGIEGREYYPKTKTYIFGINVTF